MPSTRIRGSMPTIYEHEVETHYVTEQEFLAQLDELDEFFRIRYEEYVQQTIEEAKAEYRYHLSPDTCDSDNDKTPPFHTYGPLSSPLSTPPRSPLFATHPLRGLWGTHEPQYAEQQSTEDQVNNQQGTGEGGIEGEGTEHQGIKEHDGNKALDIESHHLETATLATPHH